MASNSFGKIFKITTWGESHGKAIGVVIDGCPAGIEISEAEMNSELALRAPGKNAFTSPRQEKDQAIIYSGIYEGKTTGSPIAILIENRDTQSASYEEIKDIYRPGHANFTYLQKYGIFDYRGGGRSSARETVARVAAGSIAKKILQASGIKVTSFLKELAGIALSESFSLADLELLKRQTLESPVFCPEEKTAAKMMDALAVIKEKGDSIGGIVETWVSPVPVGLGDPVYEKLEARLAYAMLGLPASKAFEIGEGFFAARMMGSRHNDLFTVVEEEITLGSNHAGGTLGGISNGMPLVFRVGFKPTSSVKLPQSSVTIEGEKTTFELSEHSRHDPCVAIRAVPIVEAMTSLVLADALLMNRLSKFYVS